MKRQRVKGLTASNFETESLLLIYWRRYLTFHRNIDKQRLLTSIVLLHISISFD